MSYSLVDHPRNYQITNQDACFSLATGLSGAPFAHRHAQLAQSEGSASRWHRVVMMIEYMPLIGGVVALVEKIAFHLFHSGYSAPFWRTTALSADQALNLMETNGLYLASEMHQKDSKIYFSPKEIEANLKTSAPLPPLTFTHQHTSRQGPRSQNEDAHFCKKIEGGLLAGVFDGHGGKEVAHFACEAMQSRFSTILKEENGDVHAAFERSLYHIQLDVARNSSWNRIGSTAVVSYLDEKTHKIYTATIGDSAAHLYRRSGLLGVKSLPLSIVHDWTTEYPRLVKIYGLSLVQFFYNIFGRDPKRLRSHLFSGVNVSRALGDIEEAGIPTKRRVISKPEITSASLKSGDVVLLCCDGVTDYLLQKDIVAVMRGHFGPVGKLIGNSEELVDEIANTALAKMDKKGSGDNVTALAIQVY